MEYKGKIFFPASQNQDFLLPKDTLPDHVYDQKKKNSILKSFHVYLVTIHRDPCSHRIRSKIEKQIQDAKREREREKDTNPCSSYR